LRLKKKNIASITINVLKGNILGLFSMYVQFTINLHVCICTLKLFYMTDETNLIKPFFKYHVVVSVVSIQKCTYKLRKLNYSSSAFFPRIKNKKITVLYYSAKRNFRREPFFGYEI